jgi:hypothetical protein
MRSQGGGGANRGFVIRPTTLNTLTRLCFFRLYEGQYVVCWRCLKAIFPNAHQHDPVFKGQFKPTLNSVGHIFRRAFVSSNGPNAQPA